MGLKIVNDTKFLVRIKSVEHAIFLEIKPGECHCGCSKEYVKKIQHFLDDFGLTVEDDNETPISSDEAIANSEPIGGGDGSIKATDNDARDESGDQKLSTEKSRRSGRIKK